MYNYYVRGYYILKDGCLVEKETISYWSSWLRKMR